MHLAALKKIFLNGLFFSAGFLSTAFSQKTLAQQSISIAPCCETATLTFSVISQSHSEPVSVRAWSNDWRDDLSPGESTHSFNQISMLYQSDIGWRVGLLSRLDYNVQFNEETARLYYEDSNGLLDETPQSPLYFSVQHLRASGVTLGYQFNIADQWTAGADLTRLRAYDLYEGNISGFFSISDDQQYAVEAQVDYAYQVDALLNRPATPATVGWGWTTDIFLRWQSLDNRLHARLDFRDAWSRITWKDVPFTQAKIDYANAVEDGSFDFNPTIEGAESVRTQHQKLPVRTRLLIEYALNYHLTSHFSAETLPVVNEWGVGLTWAIPGQMRHTLSATTLFPVGALKVQHQYGNLYWSLGMDELSWKEAHWLKIEMGMSFYF